MSVKHYFGACGHRFKIQHNQQDCSFLLWLFFYWPWGPPLERPALPSLWHSKRHHMTCLWCCLHSSLAFFPKAVILLLAFKSTLLLLLGATMMGVFDCAWHSFHACSRKKQLDWSSWEWEQPNTNFRVCSKHFREVDFVQCIGAKMFEYSTYFLGLKAFEFDAYSFL